jgi:GNAT superfamily N-acetyltransferase
MAKGDRSAVSSDQSMPSEPRDAATHVVRLARAGESRALARVLARAFDDDPISCFVYPNARRRRRALVRFFRIQLERLYVRHGEVWTTDELAGAAIWGSPTKLRWSFADLVALAPMVPSVLGTRTPAVLRLLLAIESRRPRVPHWYLATLGTDPPRQGKGVGSALLAPVLGRCDAEGLPAYLESSKERNVPFYGRHGFEVTEVLRTGGGAPPVWLMWREPQPASGGP